MDKVVMKPRSIFQKNGNNLNFSMAVGGFGSDVTAIKDFKDKALGTGAYLNNLSAAIEPRAINLFCRNTWFIVSTLVMATSFSGVMRLAH